MEKKIEKSQLQKFENFVIYRTEDGLANITVYFFNDTLWLNQKLIAELFEVDRTVITKHLKNIFYSKELTEDSVSANFAHTAEDGKTYQTTFYNLKAVIAVGFRVNSEKAIKFRIWAINTLEEFTVKGFVLDDEKLKQIKHFGQDYFDDLLERIREIRLSERRLHQKITDIFALSADYDKTATLTKEFFATVQNKLHWAITGKTASEIIYSEADAKKIFMGLKTWKNSPKRKILKSDVTIAKNYLDIKHLKELETLVSAYLDLAENRVQRRIVTNMSDWVKLLNQIIEISNYPILLDNGKISTLKAKIKAESEFEKFRITQDRLFESDFDVEVKKLLEKKGPHDTRKRKI